MVCFWVIGRGRVLSPSIVVTGVRERSTTSTVVSAMVTVPTFVPLTAWVTAWPI